MLLLSFLISHINSPLIKAKLEIRCTNHFKSFIENHMKSNPEKMSRPIYIINPVLLKIEGHSIYNGAAEKLLGVKINSMLFFECHVSTLKKSYL